MIKILICCEGGASSGFLAARLSADLKKKGLDQDYSVQCRAFSDFALNGGGFVNNHDDVDVCLLCPHLLHKAKQFLSTNTVDFPMYMIPTRIYGVMDLQTLIEDATDIIEVFKVKHENLAHFEGEDNPLYNKRIKSYRQTYKK